MKTTWEKLNDLRKYVLELNINEDTPFKKIGKFTFYTSNDYVSIDEKLKDDKKRTWDLHPTSAMGNVKVLGIKQQTRESAIEEMNAEWDSLDNVDDFIKRVKTATKSYVIDIKNRQESIKKTKIARLKKEIAELEGKK